MLASVSLRKGRYRAETVAWVERARVRGHEHALPKQPRAVAPRRFIDVDPVRLRAELASLNNWKV